MSTNPITYARANCRRFCIGSLAATLLLLMAATVSAAVITPLSQSRRVTALVRRYYPTQEEVSQSFTAPDLLPFDKTAHASFGSGIYARASQVSYFQPTELAAAGAAECYIGLTQGSYDAEGRSTFTVDFVLDEPTHVEVSGSMSLFRYTPFMGGTTVELRDAGNALLVSEILSDTRPGIVREFDHVLELAAGQYNLRASANMSVMSGTDSMHARGEYDMLVRIIPEPAACTTTVIGLATTGWRRRKRRG